jgi:hypothetical protein
MIFVAGEKQKSPKTTSGRFEFAGRREELVETTRVFDASRWIVSWGERIG